MDRIILPEIPLRARVGVSAEERASDQEILVDLELGLDLSAAGTSDDLGRAVDYEAVCEAVAAVARSRPFRLIEAIAEECARAVLEAFAVEEVRVRVRKPGALRSRGVPYAAVEVLRRLSDVFLGLGSNVGDGVGQLRHAVLALEAFVSVERVSSLWLTEPVGLREQPSFVNAVLRGRTALEPRALLAAMAEVEDRMGRRRDVPNGPRTIDLDLLLYDHVAADEPGLTLPHPRMRERRFVLAPLAEIAPDVHPRADGPSIAELLAALPWAEAVERIEHPEWPPPLG